MHTIDDIWINLTELFHDVSNFSQELIVPDVTSQQMCVVIQ